MRMDGQEQKRIAIFMPALHEGGAQRQMLNLAQGIADRGHAVDFVLAKAEGPYLPQVPKCVELVDLSEGRPVTWGRTWRSLPALVRYLRQRRPAAMLAVLNRAGLAAVSARRMAGVETTIAVSQRNTLTAWAQESRDWRNWMTLQLTKRMFRQADAVTTVSHGAADDLSQVTKIPRDQIDVIYNPVVTPILKEKMQAPLDHPWFQPGEPPVVLAVGRLSEQKDYPTLLESFARLRTERTARLVILGEGEQRASLEARVKELGIERDVQMPGWVENPYPYMVRAGLFVLSSKFEGLPGVLIEALYCGAPLVATDCPSGPREILADGRYGTLVPIGDVASISDAMSRALAKPTERPPRESWLKFEMETVVDQYLQLLLGDSLPTVPLPAYAELEPLPR